MKCAESCLECSLERCKYDKTDKETYQREWAAAHRDQRKAYQKAYYQAHRKELLEKAHKKYLRGKYD